MSLHNISDRTSLLDMQRWLVLPGYVLFFLMLAFPMVVSLLYVKVFLFAVLLVIVAVRGLTCLRLDLHPKVIMWTWALAVVGLFFGLRGMFLGTPGAVKCVQVYVMWPLIYVILLGGIDRMQTLQGLEKTLIFSTVFIGLFGAVYSLSQLNILSEIPYLDSLVAPDDLGSGIFDGYARLAFPGLNSLPFLVPFLMAAVVTRWRQPGKSSISTMWLWIALFLSLIVALLAGRRALLLVTMLTPLLILILGSFQPPKERLLVRRSLGRVTLVLVLGVGLAVLLLRPIYAITFEGIADRFSAGFDFSATTLDDSPADRSQQYIALVRGWAEYPLIGAGLGASAHGSIRSEIMPWAYELYYLALLFQTGLLGFLAYTAGIVWIYSSGIGIIKRGGVDSQLLIPILVGTSGLLIANGTNPYLARFDGIWVIFLPLAFINYSLLSRDRAHNPTFGHVHRLREQL